MPSHDNAWVVPYWDNFSYSCLWASCIRAARMELSHLHFFSRSDYPLSHDLEGNDESFLTRARYCFIIFPNYSPWKLVFAYVNVCSYFSLWISMLVVCTPNDRCFIFESLTTKYYRKRPRLQECYKAYSLLWFYNFSIYFFKWNKN